MKTCPNCNFEFERNFCPNCGTKYEDPEKPNLVDESKLINPKKLKIYKLVGYASAILLALFSVLLPIFYIASVVKFDFGIVGFPSESLGSVWKIAGGVSTDILTVDRVCKILVIALIANVVIAIFTIAANLSKQLKFKKNLRTSLTFVSFLIYIFYTICAFVIIGAIRAADGGIGFLKAGACVIFLILFSLLFLFASIFALCYQIALVKKCPELKWYELKEYEKEKALFFETHIPPQKPSCKSKKDLRIKPVWYKHAMKRYKRAKEGDPNGFLVWLDAYKVRILAGSLAIAALITTAIVLFVTLTNKFKLSVVEKIEIGYTQEQVLDILGEPYEGSKNSATWEYYYDEYEVILSNLEANRKAQIESMMSGGLDGDLVTEEAALRSKLAETETKYIEIQFDSNMRVSAVIFETAYEYVEESNLPITGNAQKELEKFEISDRDILINTSNSNIKTTGCFYYTDGSYRLMILPTSMYSELDTSVLGKQKINCKDEWGTFSHTFNIVKSISGNVNGIKYDITYKETENGEHTVLTLSGSGTIQSSDSYPWSEYELAIRELIVADSADITVPKEAFSGLSNLKYATIPGEIPIPTQNLRALTITKGSVGNQFAGAEYLTTVILNEGITSIGENAFSGCIYLENITIPNSVTSIGASACSNCTSLQSINFNGTKKKWNEINKGTDWDISAGNYTLNFYFTKGLSYTLINNGTAYEISSIGTAKDTDVVIPSIYNDMPVTSIGDEAFEGCSSLTIITIPDSVTSIGSSAFRGCRCLTSITIPDSVTSIGHSAFEVCSSLESITIGDSVTSIGHSAFFGCSSLTSITIPDSVTSIGHSAFVGCSSLTSITIPDSVTSIDDSAFRNCSSLTSITIPDSVTSIGEYAFYSCSSLSSITIPDSVTSIDQGAFAACSSLTSITIPDSVTSIVGMSVFAACNSLTSVTVEEGNSVYHSAGNCLIETASKTLIAGCKNSIIPTDGSVTSIEDYAFSGCESLTSITIPDSVTSIYQGAFRKCSKLTSITFQGTKLQWNEINKSSNWDSDTGSYTIHCTDGDISK